MSKPVLKSQRVNCQFTSSKWDATELFLSISTPFADRERFQDEKTQHVCHWRRSPWPNKHFHKFFWSKGLATQHVPSWPTVTHPHRSVLNTSLHFCSKTLAECSAVDVCHSSNSVQFYFHNFTITIFSMDSPNDATPSVHYPAGYYDLVDWEPFIFISLKRNPLLLHLEHTDSVFWIISKHKLLNLELLSHFFRRCYWPNGFRDTK